MKRFAQMVVALVAAAGFCLGNQAAAAPVTALSVGPAKTGAALAERVGYGYDYGYGHSQYCRKHRHYDGSFVLRCRPPWSPVRKYVCVEKSAGDGRWKLKCRPRWWGGPYEGPYGYGNGYYGYDRAPYDDDGPYGGDGPYGYGSRY